MVIVFANVTLFDRIMMYFLIAVILYLIFRALKKADIQHLHIRTALTIPVAFAIYEVMNMPISPFLPIFGTVLGLCIAVIWAGPAITVLIQPLLNGFYPNEELEDAPVYSSAIRLRNQGLFNQAIEAINKELQKFPEDPQGYILKSQIFARNMREPEEAINQLEAFLTNEGHPPSPQAQIVILNQLAEVCLEYLNDRTRACGYFKVVVDQYPDSEAGQAAEQRIAQLMISSAAKAKQPIQKLEVESSGIDYGLEFGRDYVDPNLKKPIDDIPIDELRTHLIEYPKNFAARKELVSRLVNEENQPEEAIHYIQEALEIPYQSMKQRADWFHTMADIQIKQLDNINAARATLLMLANEDPGSAMASIAQKRLATLKRELEPLKEKQRITMGEYEPDIGLKVKRKDWHVPDKTGNASTSEKPD